MPAASVNYTKAAGKNISLYIQKSSAGDGLYKYNEAPRRFKRYQFLVFVRFYQAEQLRQLHNHNRSERESETYEI